MIICRELMELCARKVELAGIGDDVFCVNGKTFELVTTLRVSSTGVQRKRHSIKVARPGAEGRLTLVPPMTVVPKVTHEFGVFHGLQFCNTGDGSVVWKIGIDGHKALAATTREIAEERAQQAAQQAAELKRRNHSNPLWGIF
ncbi:hypothetical protein SAMN05216548_11490 [Faunimonas pinastri]|uniref:Uncharacterized protein n=1 Tax=Faunimonas pinastri TaxID=1855383 RepID=A0A1H9MX33_9HYPH|nr:hypothetical protein [Faunimonas pinastri]SER28262.1 hypothetical protein SAMN05216548_11490 [Faunimonas pinastri]